MVVGPYCFPLFCPRSALKLVTLEFGFINWIATTYSNTSKYGNQDTHVAFNFFC